MFSPIRLPLTQWLASILEYLLLQRYRDGRSNNKNTECMWCIYSGHSLHSRLDMDSI